ncbi:MAG: cytochrome P450 [Bacteroidota bacterium]
MEKSKMSCPFGKVRAESGLGYMNDQEDPVQMVLRLRDLRKCAHDWRTFSSEKGEIGRVVVPSEVYIRDTRQIPFEVDPPKHAGYRKLVADWFRRPMKPEYIARLRTIVDEMIDSVLDGKELDLVSEFALPIQSRALTVLLNSNYEESDVWISWGTHVFRGEDEGLDADKAALLYDYIDDEIERARKNPSEDLYSVLLATELDGRPLTKEEIKGIMILTFAGGRDTVINIITNSLAYFAEHFDALMSLKGDETAIGKAIEELIRYYSPLTQLARVATKDTEVCGAEVKENTRISLCYSSANRDETVFESPDEIKFDRKINPHVAFGFSTHNCLGSTHARALMRELIKSLIEKVGSIKLNDGKEKIEELGEFRRKVGFEMLNAQFFTKGLGNK